jgi:hypothetical protein
VASTPATQPSFASASGSPSTPVPTIFQQQKKKRKKRGKEKKAKENGEKQKFVVVLLQGLIFSSFHYFNCVFVCVSFLEEEYSPRR